MTRFPKFITSIGYAGIVLVQSVGYFPSVFLRSDGRRDLFRQLYATGIRTLPVVTVVSIFMGMILALQVGLELARFNQENYLGAAVMLTLLREMAAFCCGICMAACVGSAIAAEIGTMKVNDEIDALRIMGIPPVRFLAAPRILALLLMSPVVAFYCCIMGTIGGGTSALWMAADKDLFVGIAKAAVFGVLVGDVSFCEGMGASLGATGVGKATVRNMPYCGRSSLKWLVSTKTPTTCATECCLRNFAAHFAA